MAYWLKPFGTTDPPRHIDPDWIHDPERAVDLDRWEILSGPSADKPPQMGTNDKLIFHAVHWSTMFGIGEILAPPTYQEHRKLETDSRHTTLLDPPRKGLATSVWREVTDLAAKFGKGTVPP